MKWVSQPTRLSVVVACAIAAHAEMFVTGDKALLGLQRVQDMPVRSPREFWTQMTAL